MLRVGLTGGIASGKSTVARMFGALGCYLLDSDHITHELFHPGTAVNAAVAAAFGPGIVAPDGSIDRKKLASIVFSSPELREQLNSLVHPAIKEHQRRYLEQVEAADPKAIAIVEAALMVEAGTYKNYDKLIVVTCSPEIQHRRLGERSGLDAQEIESRIASQMKMEEKVKVADFIIDNSGDLEKTRGEVESVYRKLRALADET